jgi:hypothetical protein
MAARLVLGGLVAGLATASQSAPRIAVPVGEVREVDVDFKIGFACDDASILRASMVTRDGHNWFVVEGVAPGATHCRVGTDPFSTS